MPEFTLTASAWIKLTVQADDESAARALVMENLQDADTDFIRGDHYDAGDVVAEIHIERIL